MKRSGVCRKLWLIGGLWCLVACTPSKEKIFPGDVPGDMQGGTMIDDGIVPDLADTITVWEGQMADDVEMDVVGSDADLYHEANSFDATVTVIYKGDSASVESTRSDIRQACSVR